MEISDVHPHQFPPQVLWNQSNLNSVWGVHNVLIQNHGKFVKASLNVVRPLSSTFFTWLVILPDNNHTYLESITLYQVNNYINLGGTPLYLLYRMIQWTRYDFSACYKQGIQLKTISIFSSSKFAVIFRLLTQFIILWNETGYYLCLKHRLQAKPSFLP